MTTQAEMPRYQCHKQVWALKITKIEADGLGDWFLHSDGFQPTKVDAAWIEKFQPEPGGYLVVYEDGYRSFSPGKVFEAGYTRI